jgi:PAS domain S-box-containing protein
MSRILLLLEHIENRRLLSEWLERYYEIIFGDATVLTRQAVPLLDDKFDLCVMDGVALNHLWEWVRARKQAEHPVFLPFLLITMCSDVKLLTRDLWQSIDELITKPIEKLELHARIEMLLRSRQLSLELNATNIKLQQEIAEREQAVSLLRQSELRFRRIVQSSIVGIVIADFDGNIHEANNTFLQIVGYTQQDLEAGRVHWIDMTPSEYLPLDERAIEQIKATGDYTVYEKEYIRKDGSRVPVLVGAIQLEPEQPNVVAFILDITERKIALSETQKALEQEKELNQLKSRFVSMVSHEFRNPLNIINGYAALIEKQGAGWSQEKQVQVSQKIKKAVNNLVSLLDDVLIISKGQVGKQAFNPTPINLKQYCQNLVAEMQLVANPAHQICLLAPEPEINVDLDETLLQQILTNLLSNAIKYSPQGGDILFELTYNDEIITFKIADKGIGISKEDQQKLFESFYRAKNVNNIPGTGLGLAIVKQAVELHQGKINVTSDLGVGTTFIITIPVGIDI